MGFFPLGLLTPAESKDAPDLTANAAIGGWGDGNRNTKSELVLP